MRPRYEFGDTRLVGPPGWRRLPPVTRATLLLSAAGYLTGLFVPLLFDVLVADPVRIFPGGEAWRLVTYPLAIAGIWNALFGLLLFWTFGAEMEPEWGSMKYALFLVAATAAAGVLGTAAARFLLPGGATAAGAGLSGLLTALIVAWTLRGPRLPVHFFGLLPMTRRGFALLALVLVVFGELDVARLHPLPLRFALARLLFVLGGLPVSWLFARGGGRMGRPGSLWPPRLIRRRRFRVVRDGGFPPTVN